MTPGIVKNEPVAVAGLAIALAALVTAFTDFTVEQDLAVNTLAIALASFLARRNVTPVNKL